MSLLFNKLVGALLALACASSLSSAQTIVSQASPQAWKNFGPAPISGGNTGRISAIAASTTNANRIYVAGADGGVWRTDTGGSSWKPLTDKMPTQAVGALALDPNNHDVIFVGTGEANYANHSRSGLGIYKSVDAGETWQQHAESVFGGRSFSRLLIHPNNNQVLYGAVTRAGGFPELAAAKGHPGATGNLGIFKSTDGGVNWTHLSGGLPNLSATDLCMDPTAPDTLYAAIGRIFGSNQNGIYKSTNGGTSWNKLSGGLPNSGIGRISLGIAPSQPQRVYALLTNPSSSTGANASTLGGFRTDDGGSSWTSSSPGNIQASYGWYLSTVLVHPTNPSQVYMGGFSLARSTNSGSGWSTVTPPHVDLHALAWDANGNLLAGDDGGLHKSTNGGNFWTALNDGLGIIQLYAGFSTHPSDPHTVLGGFQDNGTNLRNSSGTTWFAVFGGDGGWTQIDQQNPLRMFVEFQGTGNLYRSSNGGTSFDWVGGGVDSGDRNCFLPPFLISAQDSSRMLYATHRVYRSTNSGSSWNAISGDLTSGNGAIRSLAQAPSDSQIVWAATTDGRVLRSQNGGSNFTLIESGHPGWPRVTRELTIHPDDPSTVYLAGAAFGVEQVRRTQDGGGLWTSLDGDLPDVPVNVIDVLPTEGIDVLFAGTDAGLYVSYSDGQHWRPYGKGLPKAVVVDIKIDGPRKRILVATQGRGVWKAKLLLAQGL
ncbi:MAG: photosystem II stability/assembly factor-like uncharacterized protein [Planctomycetota bacterium]|jgi:photosystem II stability/assembly factor-like uncharacterized protein